MSRLRGSSVLPLFSVCCILILASVKCQSPCTTPSGTPGTCITITTCPALLKILQNRGRPASDTKLLRDSQCGVDSNRTPLVCCSQKPNAIPCNTPDNTQGTCIALRNCAYLLELFNGPKPLPIQTVQYLRRSTCQGPDRYSVCCGEGQPNVPSPPPVTPAPPVVPDDGEGPVNNEGVDALLPSPTECGKDAATDRIFGGEVTNIDQYPWMALVEYRTKRNTKALGCGASLISSRYIVTAGHCVIGDVLTQLGTPISIRLGEFNKTSTVDCVPVPGGGEDCNDDPVTIDIETIIAHPEYKPSTGSQKNDIALIRLAANAPYTDFIRPICLPRSDVTASDMSKRMVVAGWGATESGRNSDVKLHLTLSLVGIQQCQNAYNQKRLRTELWEKQMCAGGQKGKDSCRGDSGGPLMAEENLQWTLHGVVSFGPTPCALEDVPGVYTKTFSYINWIRRNIKP